MLTSHTHQPTACPKVPYTAFPADGHWSCQFRCPACGRVERLNISVVGHGEMLCYGTHITPKKNLSSKQLASQYPLGSMPLAVVELMYRLRDEEILALSEKPSITHQDVQELERTGRFRIAAEFWDKCDDTARAALLDDQHHGVRSAARISAQRNGTGLPAP